MTVNFKKNEKNFYNFLNKNYHDIDSFIKILLILGYYYRFFPEERVLIFLQNLYKNWKNNNNEKNFLICFLNNHFFHKENIVFLNFFDQNYNLLNYIESFLVDLIFDFFIFLDSNNNKNLSFYFENNKYDIFIYIIDFDNYK